MRARFFRLRRNCCNNIEGASIFDCTISLLCSYLGWPCYNSVNLTSAHITTKTILNSCSHYTHILRHPIGFTYFGRFPQYYWSLEMDICVLCAKRVMTPIWIVLVDAIYSIPLHMDGNIGPWHTMKN